MSAVTSYERPPFKPEIARQGEKLCEYEINQNQRNLGTKFINISKSELLGMQVWKGDKVSPFSKLFQYRQPMIE